MDPLSDVLASLKPQSYAARGFGFTGDLALQWPRHTGIKCYAILSGECWLVLEGITPPTQLAAGDCFLLPRGLPFCLTTDVSLKPVDFFRYREERERAGLGLDDGPASRYIVGGHFVLQGEHAGMLLGSLPPIVHIRSEADKAAMRWALDRLRIETVEEQPGSSLMAQQLAYMMLIQALRLHLLDAAPGRTGWLFALADNQMRTAIASMHDAPGKSWTLGELAARVGMSRSVFAERFRETVGTTPMEYLTRWRMLLASQTLRNSDCAVSSIAASLGYESDSAFGKAFRKVMGTSPRDYRKRPVGDAQEGVLAPALHP